MEIWVCPSCDQVLEQKHYCKRCKIRVKSPKVYNNGMVLNQSTIKLNQNTDEAFYKNKAKTEKERKISDSARYNSTNGERAYSQPDSKGSSSAAYSTQRVSKDVTIHNRTNNNTNNNRTNNNRTNNDRTNANTASSTYAKPKNKTFSVIIVIIGIITALSRLSNTDTFDDIKESLSNFDTNLGEIAEYNVEETIVEDIDEASDGTLEDYEGEYIEADYDEIMAAGIGSSGVNHYPINGDKFSENLVDKMESKYGETDILEPIMSNSIWSNGEYEYTYYETYWYIYFGENLENYVFIDKDTVTEELIEFAVVSIDPKVVFDLVSIGLKEVEPNISKSDLKKELNDLEITGDVQTLEYGNSKIIYYTEEGYFYFTVYSALLDEGEI